jgi:hypothetical protein
MYSVQRGKHLYKTGKSEFCSNDEMTRLSSYVAPEVDAFFLLVNASLEISERSIRLKAKFSPFLPLLASPFLSPSLIAQKRQIATVSFLLASTFKLPNHFIPSSLYCG